MQNFRYMMPLEMMEHISRQKLCDDFDNILDRVDKEDTGFVIVDQHHLSDGNHGMEHRS